MKVRLVDRGHILWMDDDATWAEELGVPFGTELDVWGWVSGSSQSAVVVEIGGLFREIPIDTIEPVVE